MFEPFHKFFESLINCEDRLSVNLSIYSNLKTCRFQRLAFQFSLLKHVQLFGRLMKFRVRRQKIPEQIFSTSGLGYILIQVSTGSSLHLLGLAKLGSAGNILELGVQHKKVGNIKQSTIFRELKYLSKAYPSPGSNPHSYKILNSGHFFNALLGTAKPQIFLTRIRVRIRSDSKRLAGSGSGGNHSGSGQLRIQNLK